MNYIDKLKNILKDEGLRYTKQRQQVWDEIRTSSEHRDAEEIYIQINKASKSNHGEKVSRATVYRTIDVLVKNNLKKIIINIQTNNQIAKKFYEKNGFIVAKGSKSGKIKMLKNLE